MASSKSNKAVIVTGASRGIGAAICDALVSRGFAVASLSRTGTLSISDSISDSGRCRAYACDVSSEAQLAECFRQVDKDFDGIQALVNNAGVHSGGPSHEFSTNKFRSMLETNTIGVFVASREVYPYLRRAGGDIINIGSIFEVMGAAYNTCYSASKAAVGGLTRALACEWGPENINVVNVAPGFVITDMNTAYMEREDVRAYFKRQTTIGRALQPEEIGRLTALLLDSDLTLLNGQTIRADGGHSFAHGAIK